ncbi:MAG: 1-aminocyclopropane-1-carboxylate deaminase/D-cysteine desulfhydrase, partial [Promethearchaeota archaeon]
MTKEISLYRYFPEMVDLPRIELVNLPTPVQKLENVCKTLDCSNIWVKRDDLSNPKYGGNKPRKYEFILVDALKKNKKHLLTTGGIGSNHALANTLFAKDLGMESHVYLFNQPLTEYVRENLLCDQYYGAHFHYTKGINRTKLAIVWKLIRDRQACLIWPGGSNSIGTVGFVNAGLELAEQVKAGEIPEPDKLFVAVGSNGTCAGLLLGLELAGLKTRVIGIGVSYASFANKKEVLKLARNTLKLMQNPSIPDVNQNLMSRLDVTHEFYGGEYGRVTYEGLEAIEIIKQDAIQLELTYTAKTFSALVAYCQENERAKEEILLFWNTQNSVDFTPVYNKVD